MSATETRKQPAKVEAGQRWTFVHSSGRETEYVVVVPTDDDERRFWARWEHELKPSNLCYLLNEATGKMAMVTYGWLRQKPREGWSHWLPPVSS